MKTSFLTLDTPESLQIVRDIAAEVWPKTFAPILPPEQIPYMMDMMYAPEVMERELREGYKFAALLVDGKPSGYISWSPYGPDTASAANLYPSRSSRSMTSGAYIMFIMYGICSGGRIGANVFGHTSSAISRTV